MYVETVPLCSLRGEVLSPKASLTVMRYQPGMLVIRVEQSAVCVSLRDLLRALYQFMVP